MHSASLHMPLPPDQPDFGSAGPHRYQKRHASFDSPREVPLPSPSQDDTPLMTRPQNDYFPPQSPSSSTDSLFDDTRSDSTANTSLSSSCSPNPATPRTTTISTPIFPFSRPYSVPSQAVSDSIPEDHSTHWTDRHSSASLPLPANVPFHTLPKAQQDAVAARQTHRSEIPQHYPYNHTPYDSSSTSGESSPSPNDTPAPPLPSSSSPSPPPLRRRASASRVPPRIPTSTSTSSPTPYPAPDPPTILAPTASPGPFLSHAPPPPDSWIQVETSASEYRLVVRLPGFKRDGITLATKRRRILHVVADCWENGGGHFERRISFGYDADLVQVRAEFDGEMLKISIPRRLPPVEMWPARTGPVGRSG